MRVCASVRTRDCQLGPHAPLPARVLSFACSRISSASSAVSLCDRTHLRPRAIDVLDGERVAKERVSSVLCRLDALDELLKLREVRYPCFIELERGLVSPRSDAQHRRQSATNAAEVWTDAHAPMGRHTRASAH